MRSVPRAAPLHPAAGRLTTTVFSSSIAASQTYTADSRIPTIEMSSPEGDSLRRDFTVNAMYYNIKQVCAVTWAHVSSALVRRRALRPAPFFPIQRGQPGVCLSPFRPKG